MNDFLASLRRYGQDPLAAAAGANGLFPGAGSGGSAAVTNPGMVMPSGNTGGSFFDPESMRKWMGGTDATGAETNGILPTGLQALGGIGSLYLGMKQYGLAKDSLNENQRQFDLNFGNQQKLTNARMEDRQRARVASNPNQYQSVSDYMNKNGV